MGTEKNQKLELLNEAIKRVIKENNGDDERLLLSRLLSQVESLKEDEGEEKEGSSSSDDVIDRDEIVKELKNVKKQNTVTHWLLSGVIVLMLVWQISEVSLILKIKGVKDGLTNRFRGIGDFFGKAFKHRIVDEVTDGVAGVLNPTTTPPTITTPDLPQLEIPALGMNGHRDDDDD